MVGVDISDAIWKSVGFCHAVSMSLIALALEESQLFLGKISPIDAPIKVALELDLQEPVSLER